MTEIEAEQQLYAEECRKVERSISGGLILLQRGEPFDFKVAITRMLTRYSYRQIGAALGVAHTTVQGWHEGSRPNFEDGRAFVQLYETTYQAAHSTS